MSDPEQLGQRLAPHGNQYRHIQVREGATVQLGNTYHISREDPLGVLPFATNAPFNSYDRQHEPACLPNTRVDLLQGIYDWADGKDRQDKRCIFWLKGLAGTGKSTISRTVARRYNEQKHLGASFFFSKGGGDYIREAVIKRSDIASLSLSEQWRQLVLSPLSNLQGESFQSYILVVDALDECEDDKDVRIILQLLAEARSLATVRLRVFLTSRPEIPIRHGICAIDQAEHQDFALHSIHPTIVNHDISLFLEYNLGIIRKEWTLGTHWPGEEVLRQLVLYASGLFIWAATACRFIREGKGRFARKRLDTILKGSSSAVTAPEKHLNEIYLAVLKYSISSDYSEEEKEEARDSLKHTLGSIVVLFSPLSASSLSRLLHYPKEEIDQILEDLYSILDIPEDPTYPLRLHHPSFRDFLLKKDRCRDFWVDEKEAHQILGAGCIQLMSQTLKKDICEMHAPGSQASQVDSSWIKKCLPPEVQYACLYWIQHLQRSGSQVHDGEEAHLFLQAHLLHWLEALGWMGKTSEGIQAILSLEAYIQVNASPNFHAFVHDVKRFALYNRLLIEQSPLQLYCSALIFAPEKSIIRESFEKCIPTWIETKPRVQAHWSAALQTLEGHSGEVNSVAFSYDSKLLASASDDYTVRIWDAATGMLQPKHYRHSGKVHSVTFSYDSMLLASASHDQTVRIWDIATGTLQQTLWGHKHGAWSVAFSHDSKLLVSASTDKILRIWDVATGALRQTLEGHTCTVFSVAFSHNSKLLASSGDIVRIWDTAIGTLQQTLEGHTSTVFSVAFSHDSMLLASASSDGAIQIWDIATSTLQQTLKGHSHSFSPVYSVAFSHDSKLLASGSYDQTVQIWDVATSSLQQMLKGHSSSVKSVAFSHSSKLLASASDDKTIRIWDIATSTPQQKLKGHSNSVFFITFSHNSKLLASASGDHTVRIWDTATSTLQQTFEWKDGTVKSVAFSHNSKLLVSTSEDNILQIWDVATGSLQQMLKGHNGTVMAVAFSHDSKLLASASDDKIVRIWNTASGTLQQILKEHSDKVNSVTFSYNSKLLASTSEDTTVRIWDTATGTLQQTLEGHRSSVNSVAFSHNSKLLATSGYTIRIWDTATGTLQQTLWHDSQLVAFSHDSKLLASSSEDKRVEIWDAATGMLQQRFAVDAFISNLSFDYTNSILITNIGCIKIHRTRTHSLPISFQEVSEKSDRNGLGLRGAWVVWNDQNLLWLPPDIRATTIGLPLTDVSLSGSTVAMGCVSGEVFIIGISLSILGSYFS